MMTRRMRWLSTGLLAAAGLAAVLVPASPSHAAEVSPSAYVAKASIKLLGSQPVTAGPLAYANSSSPRASVASIPVLRLASVGVGQSTVGDDYGTGAQVATATVAKLKAALAGLDVVAGVSLNAKVVTARCTAVPGEGLTGTTRIVGGTLGAISLPMSPGANWALRIPSPVLGEPSLGTLVLNEQIPNPDGSLTVYGAHLKLNAVKDLGLASADLVVAAATCGPA